MPELPEVETTQRGIAPYLLGKKILHTHVHQSQLRWPVDAQLAKKLQHQAAKSIERRAKYILVHFDHGSMILHLGMSGSLRLVESGTARQKHDHIEWQLENGLSLRLHDPRRFGAVLWCEGDPTQHPLLAKLGIEPLDTAFDGAYLQSKLQHRHTAIKPMLMNAQIVVGVGNIYANEGLFLCGLDPRRPCSSLGTEDYQRLSETIRQLLQRAIVQGGTTLRDFINPHGKPGYFQQTLNVYGRADEPCRVCGTKIAHIKQAQRSTFYCPCCQV